MHYCLRIFNVKSYKTVLRFGVWSRECDAGLSDLPCWTTVESSRWSQTSCWEYKTCFSIYPFTLFTLTVRLPWRHYRGCTNIHSLLVKEGVWRHCLIISGTIPAIRAYAVWPRSTCVAIYPSWIVKEIWAWGPCVDNRTTVLESIQIYIWLKKSINVTKQLQTCQPQLGIMCRCTEWEGIENARQSTQ